MESTRKAAGNGHPGSPVIELPAPFINGAGKIQNIAMDSVGSVAVIFSASGTERSNHWHKTDSHVLYVVSGAMFYHECGLDESLDETTGILVNKGQAVFTPPERPHRCRFPVDTVLVSASRLSRDHETHEADLVRL